jgi:hypothetical protein
MDLNEAYSVGRTGSNPAAPVVPGNAMTNPAYDPYISGISAEIPNAIVAGAARITSPPSSPTSSGLPVGTVNTPTADVAPGTGATVTGTEQVAAPSDDSGYGVSASNYPVNAETTET